MKQLVSVVLLFLTSTLYAQEVAYTSKAKSTEKTELTIKSKANSTNLEATKLELQALKKENQHLKMLLKEYGNCVNERHKGEVARLNVGKAVKQQKMKKRKVKMLPPPL